MSLILTMDDFGRQMSLMAVWNKNWSLFDLEIRIGQCLTLKYELVNVGPRNNSWSLFEMQ